MPYLGEEEEEGTVPWKVPKWYPFTPLTTTSTGATGVNINLAVPPYQGSTFPGGTAVIAIAGCDINPHRNISSCTINGVAGTLLAAVDSLCFNPISIFSVAVTAGSFVASVVPTATGTMTNGYAAGGIMLYPGDSNLASFTPIDTEEWHINNYSVTSSTPIPLNHSNKGLSMVVLSKTGTGSTTWINGTVQDDLTFASSIGKFSIAVQIKSGIQNISTSFAAGLPGIVGLSWAV